MKTNSVFKLVSLIVSHIKVSKLYFYKCTHFLLFLSLSTILIHQFHPCTKILTLIFLIPTPIPPISTPVPSIHTLISRIIILIPRNPTLMSRKSHLDFPYSHHDSLHSHPFSPYSHPDSLHSHHSHPDSPHTHHSPHSVPRFATPAITDSRKPMNLKVKLYKL